MLNATDPISVTLTAQEWNIIMAALHEVAKRIADPLIQKIGEQARTQFPPETPPPGLRPNGEAEQHAPD